MGLGLRAWRLLWARMCVCRAGAVLVCLCVCVCCMGGMWVASPLGAERLKAAQPQGAFKCGVWGRGAGGSWLQARARGGCAGAGSAGLVLELERKT